MVVETQLKNLLTIKKITKCLKKEIMQLEY